MEQKANLHLYGISPDQAATAKIDSNMSYNEAVLEGLTKNCPQEVINKQCLLELYYYSFDHQIHRGQVVMHANLTNEVEEAFAAAFKAKFPITSAIPISKFAWNDASSMAVDNTSGFNYRPIALTDTLSGHSFGLAIDINPFLNPHYRSNGTIVPEGAIYDATKPGSLTDGDPFVTTFKKYGWEWAGGDWIAQGRDETDWQHFEKLEN